MKPNKQAYIDFILSELNKGNVLYKDLMIDIVFNSELIKPNNGYYVYSIVNETNREILYIGKGTKNRVLSHFNNSDKYINNKITFLKSVGYDINYKILRLFESEKEAYDFEKLIIENCLLVEIDLLNIALTHKYIFIKNELRENSMFIEKCIKWYITSHWMNSWINFQDIITEFFISTKKSISKYPKLINRYKIFHFNFLDVDSISLVNNKCLISVTLKDKIETYEIAVS